VLVRVEERPVLVREGRIWASTFHPELTDDLRVHAAWLAAR
jgi:5'-phosphate synthase pdxT subunit